MSPQAKPKFKNPRAKHNFQGRSVSIAGVGAYVPAKALTNFELEKIVETTDEWITSRTGIKERRIAAKDESSAERVERWSRLATYARKFLGFRDQALRASGENEIELDGGRLIGIVEINADRVVYRERGRTERVPLDRLPDDILLAIVQQWFNAAAKPGNHIYLGVFHILRKEPDLASARGEWQLAAFGGEQEGTALQPLLADPVIKNGGQ